MFFPSDPLYKETKLLKQGKSQLHPLFKELADWISSKYLVNVLNISYDFIDDASKWSRIGIVVESFEEYGKFKELPNGVGNYRKDYQNEIAEKLCSLIIKFKDTYKELIETLFTSMHLDWDRVRQNKVFVYVTNFSSVARYEAFENIPKQELVKFINKYEIRPVWEIHANISLTVFFYTEKEKNDQMGNPVFNVMKSEYYDLLLQHDEFGYYNGKAIHVSFDSKENLDENFEGSFFNYYR